MSILWICVRPKERLYRYKENIVTRTEHTELTAGPTGRRELILATFVVTVLYT